VPRSIPSRPIFAPLTVPHSKRALCVLSGKVRPPAHRKQRDERGTARKGAAARLQTHGWATWPPHRRLLNKRTIQVPRIPAQTAQTKMPREKTLPYRACTASGLSLVMFARLRPARRTLKKFTADNMRARNTAAKPCPPACCSPISEIAPASRAVELIMASRLSNIAICTPLQRRNSPVHRHQLILLRKHLSEPFPSNLQKTPCWNRSLVQSSFADSSPASRWGLSLSPLWDRSQPQQPSLRPAGGPVNSFTPYHRSIDCAPFKTRSLRFEWEGATARSSQRTR
jgi:hypothetical protein